jgi:hypothetical protein
MPRIYSPDFNADDLDSVDFSDAYADLVTDDFEVAAYNAALAADGFDADLEIFDGPADPVSQLANAFLFAAAEAAHLAADANRKRESRKLDHTHRKADAARSRERYHADLDASRAASRERYHADLDASRAASRARVAAYRARKRATNNPQKEIEA